MPLTSGKETSRRQVQSWWWAVSPVPRGKRTDLPRCWSHRYTMGTLGSFEVSPQAARESLSFFFDYLYTCYCPLNTPCSEGRLLFLLPKTKDIQEARNTPGCLTDVHELFPLIQRQMYLYYCSSLTAQN